MQATISQIDDLSWTATKFSDVLKVDRRVCQQALETVPARMIGKRQVWHVRDGMPAIFKRVFGIDGYVGAQFDPSQLPPKDRIDHYKAERERIKLAQEVRALIPAVEIEQVIGEAFKALSQSLDVIPDALERDAALPPESVVAVQRTIDSARESLYAAIMSITNKPDDS